MPPVSIIYKTITYFQQANYEGDTRRPASLRLSHVGIRFGRPTLYDSASNDHAVLRARRAVIQEAAGTTDTTSIGYSYCYNTLDDPIKPRHGFTFEFNQDFAGFGGDVKYHPYG